MTTVAPATFSLTSPTKSQLRHTWHVQPNACGCMQVCACLALRRSPPYPHTHSTLAQPIWQDFCPDTFSFDLIWHRQGLLCPHSIWLALDKSLFPGMTFLHYPLHADRNLRTDFPRTIYSKIFSATPYLGPALSWTSNLDAWAICLPVEQQPLSQSQCPPVSELSWWRVSAWPYVLSVSTHFTRRTSSTYPSPGHLPPLFASGKL